jgi:hypothetical protein
MALVQSLLSFVNHSSVGANIFTSSNKVALTAMRLPLHFAGTVMMVQPHLEQKNVSSSKALDVDDPETTYSSLEWSVIRSQAVLNLEEERSHQGCRWSLSTEHRPYHRLQGLDKGFLPFVDSCGNDREWTQQAL